MSPGAAAANPCRCRAGGDPPHGRLRVRARSRARIECTHRVEPRPRAEAPAAAAQARENLGRAGLDPARRATHCAHRSHDAFGTPNRFMDVLSRMTGHARERTANFRYRQSAECASVVGVRRMPRLPGAGVGGGKSHGGYSRPRRRHRRAHEAVGRMATVDRCDSVPSRFGAGDPAVAVVVPPPKGVDGGCGRGRHR